MGLLILIIIVVAIFMMADSSGSSSNSKSAYANRMIGNMPTGNAYGPKEIMYVFGCISYYALLYGQEGILAIVGMVSKNAETGVGVSMNVEDLSSISQSFPQNLKRAVDSIAWSKKTNEELVIKFSMSRADYMHIKNDCLQAYRDGLSAAKSVEGGRRTLGSLYVCTVYPHMWVIDDIAHSSEHANDYQRIF